MKVYLSGAIEHSPDHGECWRNDMSIFLKEELGHDFYNPLVEEKNYITKQEKGSFRSLKSKNLKEYRKIVRKLINGDLKSILTEIDYVVCLWDPYTEKGGGTHGELTISYYHDIPIYMVKTKPLQEISGWILGCTSEVFDDFDSLKKFLKEKYSK